VFKFSRTNRNCIKIVDDHLGRYVSAGFTAHAIGHCQKNTLAVFQKSGYETVLIGLSFVTGVGLCPEVVSP
jgi:polysaccharide deacetylase 2 family uncharacterized protein YibQ